jgi:hypothetical protein
VIRELLPPSARLIQTRGFRSSGELLDRAAEQHELAAVIGPGAVGKTFAMLAQLARRGTQAAFLDARLRHRVPELARRLREAISGQPVSTDKLRHNLPVLQELLTVRPLIVVDNAEGLTVLGRDFLRHLHEQQPTFAIVFVGGPALRTRLEEDDPFRLALTSVVDFEPLTLDGVCETIPHYHPIYARTPRESLISIDQRYANGRVGRWATFTRHALPVLEVAARTVLLPPEADAVLRKLLASPDR